ncbi:MAG: serine/threonine protein kinase, partial [Chloroflexota bacterium]|nr:serine/threonine protein kinase [Chloroflexota bacterium]
MRAAPIPPDTIIGKYRVERLLGRGGMGVVYEATQLSLDRRLALKVLRPELSEDPLFVERFRREGRLQAALDHPHVLPVYEAGESEQGLFLAMRLVPGKSLAELLAEGSLNVGRALTLLRQVAGALDAAHEAGLVHRDVKPRNVLVDPSDHAYLADFGLTRVGGESGVTASGELVGTVAYLAPEVIAGEPASPASDRYAFAAMVFECLAGEPVFPRASDAAVLYAHTSERRPRITQRRPELPTELDAVLARALDKDPRKRPHSATAIIDEIERALGAEGARDPNSRRVAGAILTAAVAAGAIAVAIPEGDRGRDRSPAPPVARGATAIGSALAPGD